MSPVVTKPAAKDRLPFSGDAGYRFVDRTLASRRPDEIIGNHRIVRLLARGGMSEVYLGENTVSGSLVAIKLLAPGLSQRRDMTQRLKTEARIGAQLVHPNIVGLRDAGMADDGRLYLVMDFVPGRTLREQLELAEDRRLRMPAALHVMIQAVCGVRFAHQRSIVHRDLKPENMMILPNGDVKICDFGIAKFVLRGEDSRDLPKLGTLRYLSPEQIRNAEVDARTDIFALGLVFYEMLAGNSPFEEPDQQATESETMARILTFEPKPLPSLDIEPPCSALAWRVVAQCLAKSPVDRFSTSERLLEALCVLARESVPPEHPENLSISRVAARAQREAAGEPPPRAKVVRLVTDAGHEPESELFVTSIVRPTLLPPQADIASPNVSVGLGEGHTVKMSGAATEVRAQASDVSIAKTVALPQLFPAAFHWPSGAAIGLAGSLAFGSALALRTWFPWSRGARVEAEPNPSSLSSDVVTGMPPTTATASTAASNAGSSSSVASASTSVALAARANRGPFLRGNTAAIASTGPVALPAAPTAMIAQTAEVAAPRATGRALFGVDKDDK